MSEPKKEEGGKVPSDSAERKRSMSVQDFLDMRTDMENMRKDMETTNKLVTQLLQGLESKVIPMLDAHESALSNLPKQLESSFEKQTENMKGYIERRLSPIDSQTGEQVKPPTPGQHRPGTGFDIQGIMGFAQKQIEQAGGLRNLLGGSNSPQMLDGEIAMLEKEMLNRQKAIVRDSLRRALGLPDSTAAVASGAVKVQAP